jgi:hypothetical protein
MFQTTTSSRARTAYTGPLAVGRDLMSFDVGDTVRITQVATK